MPEAHMQYGPSSILDCPDDVWYTETVSEYTQGDL